MKRILAASLLMATLTTPAIAEKLVYLKEGGVIRAKSAWRSGGRVHVLVNRDTLTEFTPAEIDMKRTFAGKVSKARHRAATHRRATASLPVQQSAAAVPEKRKAGFSLPSLPSLPERSPESLKGSEEGAIRKHKREMAEKIAE
jgi:hypothetical protein